MGRGLKPELWTQQEFKIKQERKSQPAKGLSRTNLQSTRRLRRAWGLEAKQNVSRRNHHQHHHHHHSIITTTTSITIVSPPPPPPSPSYHHHHLHHHRITTTTSITMSSSSTHQVNILSPAESVLDAKPDLLIKFSQFMR